MNWAFWSVKLTPVATPRVLYDELELVELVAERHRQQEQPAEDGEVDADRRREDQPAARGADDVAGEGQEQRADDQRVEQALDEAQERQLEQEEADVPVEDRVGDGWPSARTARGGSTAGPSPRRPTRSRR